MKKINKHLVIFVLLMLFLFFSCSSEKGDWKKTEAAHTVQAYEGFLKKFPGSSQADEAKSRIIEIAFKTVQSINTISAYNGFLKKYPEAPFAGEARIRIEKLYGQRHPDFRKARKIKIIADQSFGKAENVRLSFVKVSRFFDYAGLQLIKPDSEDSAVLLNIYITGEAIGQSYRPRAGAEFYTSYLYTGAAVSGFLLLEYQDKSYFKRTFQGKKDPPGDFTIASKKASGTFLSSPSAAPFAEVLFGDRYANFEEIVIEVLREACGKYFLVTILLEENERNEYIRQVALEQIKNMGKLSIDPFCAALKHWDVSFRLNAALALEKIKEPGSVKYLIAALEDEDSQVTEYAARALGEIRDRSAVKPLFNCLIKMRKEGPPEHIVRQTGLPPAESSVFEAISKITGQELTYPELMKWWKKNKDSC